MRGHHKKRTMKTPEEIAKEAENHRNWAGPKKSSMKRRCNQHDYRDRGIYMVTLCLEGRLPLLGTLEGDPTLKEGEGRAHIVLSPLGRKVKECWESIPKFHPVVEPMKLCIMPDHIHGLLFVHEKMEKHLGNVIWGFKTGCRKAARELGFLQDKQAAQIAQPTEQTRKTSDHALGTLWESGYNDRLLRGKGQLDRMAAYMDDNPRRLLLKRLYPKYFTHLGKLMIAGMEMDAMGNRFLLDNPVKIQVQCSRSLTQADIEREKTAILDKAFDQGAIIVSPCISPGEQQIATAAMAEGIALIVLLVNGLHPLFKPSKRYLEACTEGRLLILAPFPYQNEKQENMRQRCLQLNTLATQICNNE